jgi:Gpi18-like mannosyltransferase
MGIRPFYVNSSFIDYPPLNVYLFWLIGAFAETFPSIHINNWVKLMPNLFDLATAALIFLYTRKHVNPKLALVATALYAFNPAVIYNAAVWGQFDAIYTFFLVLSLVLAVRSNPKLSAVALAVAILTKPQAVALLPLVALLIYKKSGIKELLYSTATFVATIFLTVLPFDWGASGNPVSFLVNIYFGAYQGYTFTSINAFNLWGLIGMWASDTNFFVLGWVMFGAVAAFVLYLIHKRFKVSPEFLAFFAAFMLLFAFFMLPTRIHERYLFPAISMLTLLFPLYKKVRPLYIGITATLFVNQAYVLYWLSSSYPNAGPNLTGDPVVLVVGIINLILFMYGIVIALDELKMKLRPSLPEKTKNSSGGQPIHP